MPTRIRLPDPITYIFGSFEIQPENIVLDTEDPRPPKKGQVKVRALDGFVFVKNGRFVYPTYGLPDEWWQGVEAFGYIAALTGDFKYFVWAGQWQEEYPGKHMEVIIIANLRGLAKDANDHWRNGYALLEPAEEYDRGGWTRVTESWTDAPDAALPSDPSFISIKREDPRPEWWDDQGDNAWDHFQGRPTQTPEPEPIKSALRPVPRAGSKQGHQDDGPMEHIVIDSGSSDEEDPASSSGPPNPTTSKTRKVARADKRDGQGEGSASFKAKQKKRINQRASQPKSKPKPAAMPRKIPSNGRQLKRRVISGPSYPRQQKKQRPADDEHIYVPSDSSDDEVSAVSSSSPVPRSASPRGTPGTSSTDALNRESSPHDAKPDGLESAAQVQVHKESGAHQGQ
ncbi:hypothetical protein FRC11_014259 [Ceratobasidium sp. 423]|nr:hypothetical protein FRC11_014259 [Ceratobasidium sp. 423]